MKRTLAAALIWHVLVSLGCGATRPWEGITPSRPGTFDCAITEAGEMGYTVSEVDRESHRFRAEIRHGARYSTGEVLIVQVSPGDSLEVTAWMVEYYQTFTATGPESRERFEKPSALTVEDGQALLDACGAAGNGGSARHYRSPRATPPHPELSDRAPDAV